MQFSVPEWIIVLLVFAVIADRYILCHWTKRCLTGPKDDINEHMFKAVDVAVKSAGEAAKQSAVIAGILGRELDKRATYAMAVKKLMGEKTVQTVYLPKEPEEPMPELEELTGNTTQTIPSPENGRFKRRQDM